MMNKIITTLSFLLFIGSVSLAQNFQSSLYNQNLYTLNPAYIGFNDCPEINIQHKQQWDGLQDAPVNYLLNAHKKINTFIGLGLNINSWSSNLLKHNSFKMTYAYHLPLFNKKRGAKSKKQSVSANFISFGLSAGFMSQTFMVENAIVFDKSDILLTNGEQKNSAFVADFGMALNNENLKLGFYIPNLLSTKYSYENTNSNYKIMSNIILHSSYKISLNEKLDIEPSFLYKSMASNGSYMDYYMRGTWNKTIGAGIGIRTPSGIFTTIDVQINRNVKVSYSFDIANSGIANFGGNSHEILLKLNLCKKTKEEIKQEKAEAIQKAEEEEIAKAKKIEDKRLAKELKIAEEKKTIEDKKAEETKKTEDLQLAEKNKIEEQRKAQEEKVAETKKIEEQRKAQELKIAEAKKIEEQKKAQELKIAEAKKAEEAKKAIDPKLEEAKKIEEQRKAQELKIAEAKKIEEQKKAQEEKITEAKKIEEQKKAQELKIAEAKKAEEAKKAQDLKLAEAKKIEEQKKTQEEKIAEAKKIEEQKKAEDLKLADAKKAQEKKIDNKTKKTESSSTKVTTNNIEEINKSFNTLEKTLLFKLNTNKIISSNENNVLTELVEILKNNPNYKIRIIGHTDDSGESDFNMDVSIMRAAKLRRYLVENGISNDKISTYGKGETQPWFMNDCRAGRRKNRRTQIIFYK